MYNAVTENLLSKNGLNSGKMQSSLDVFTGQLSGIEQELAEIRGRLEQSTKTLDGIIITEDEVRAYLNQFRQFIKEKTSRKSRISLIHMWNRLKCSGNI